MAFCRRNRGGPGAAQARTWHLLLDRARAHDIGVLAISHDQDLIAAVTDRSIDI